MEKKVVHFAAASESGTAIEHFPFCSVVFYFSLKMNTRWGSHIRLL
jgi:hypothetical protein